ncbi:MAG: hypothetical protein HQL81_04475 [Magnetococcales bacterium]|nr:hypothetical protein [Magnetococcales bacterium]
MSLAIVRVSSLVLTSMLYSSSTLAETLPSNNSDVYSEVFPPLPADSDFPVNEPRSFYWEWMEHNIRNGNKKVEWTDLVDVYAGGAYKIETNENENSNSWVKLRLRPLSLYLPVRNEWLERIEVGFWGQYINGVYRNPGSDKLIRSPWDKYFIGPDLKLVTKYVTIDENFGIGLQSADSSSNSGQSTSKQEDDLIYNQLLIEVRWPNRESGLFPRSRIMYEYQSDFDTDFSASWIGAQPVDRVRHDFEFDQDLYHIPLSFFKRPFRITPFLLYQVERNDGDDSSLWSWGGGLSFGTVFDPKRQTDIAHLKVDFQDAGIDRWQFTMFVDLLKFR